MLFLLTSNLYSANSSYAEVISNTSHDVQQHDNNKHGDYVRKRFLSLMKKPFNKNTKTKILIIGDSHAQDFLNAIVENQFLTNGQIRTRYIPTRCQIYLGDKLNPKIHNNDKILCENSDNLTAAKAQIEEADIIILSALWRKWAAQALPQTIDNLKLTAKQKLFVIGRRSFLKLDTQAIQSTPKHKRQNLRSEVDIHQLDINALMINTLNTDVFINTHQLICGAHSHCPVFTDRLKKISFDGGHLSPDGARYLGSILFKKSPLSKIIQ